MDNAPMVRLRRLATQSLRSAVVLDLLRGVADEEKCMLPRRYIATREVAVRGIPLIDLGTPGDLPRMCCSADRPCDDGAGMRATQCSERSGGAPSKRIPACGAGTREVPVANRVSGRD